MNKKNRNNNKTGNFKKTKKNGNIKKFNNVIKKQKLKLFSGLFLISIGLALLISLYLPKIYSTFAPKPKINPVVLEKGHFWIVIPKIRVDSPIYPVVTKETLRRGVAHEPRSAYPGQGKNTIIVGHNYDPTKWIPQTTFGLLHELKKGDEVYIAFKKKVYIYEVDKKLSLFATDPKLYEQTDHEQLTLLTCMPYQNTTKRLKIIAKPKSIPK